jgi:hypothetical protein
VTTALYIALGVLVAGLVAMQVWIARSTAKLAGDRESLVRAIRIANVVLLVFALALVVYAVMWK